MQQPEPSSKVTTVKIDLNRKQLKLYTSLTLSAYREATEEQKRAWDSQFWNRSKTLKDSCFRFFVTRPLETEKLIKNGKFGNDLEFALNDKCEQAYKFYLRNIKPKPKSVDKFDCSIGPGPLIKYW